MKISHRILLILFVFKLIMPPVYSQESRAIDLEPIEFKKPDICGRIIFDPTTGEYPITLAEALTISLSKNYDIRILNAKRKQSKWNFYGKVSEWLPDLSYEYNYAYISGTVLVGFVVPLAVQEVAMESNFLLNYDINIKLYFDAQEAFYQFNAQKKELEFSRDKALLDSATKFYETLRAKLSIGILETNIEQIEEQLRINKTQVEAGIGTKFDVLRSEADLALAKQELIVAKNRYRLLQAQLANILGLPVFMQLVPNREDVFINEIFDDCFTLEHAGAIAYHKRPDLSAQHFNVKAAKAKRGSAYSTYIPNISLFGQLTQQGTARQGMFPGGIIGFTARWAGLDNLGVKGYTDIKTQTAFVEEENLKYVNKSREIEENIAKTYFNTIAARDLIRATDEELESAEESRRLSVVRLEAGIGTFIDVLQAQTTFTNARINNLRSIIGYNISQVELLFEMGEISINNILYGYDTASNKENYNKGQAKKYNDKIKENIEKAKQEKENLRKQKKKYTDEKSPKSKTKK